MLSQNQTTASTTRINRPSPRTIGLVAILLTVTLSGFWTAFAARPTGGTPTLVTLGMQERQSITAANEWVEGNIDFWLESHLYDASVRIDADSGAARLPDEIDISYSFYFSAQNSIVIDWTQDWRVSLNRNHMFHVNSDNTVSGPYACSAPSNIVSIPKGGTAILMPQNGSVCINDLAPGTPSPPDTTGNPTTGWADLMTQPVSVLNQVLPKRNEACSTIVNALCSGGVDSETDPAKEHFFRLSLVNLFGPTGLYPQSWWPNLPSGMSFALYFRSHLALTARWFYDGGGSQPEFCSTTSPGAVRNTVNRCSWTNLQRLGAGYSPGSKNHGTLQAPGIGAKTIPLPQVIAPTGFITVCKIITNTLGDTTGAQGVLTNGWDMTVNGPFSTHLTATTGSDSTGCSKFGPLFPSSGYQISEALQSGFINIGTTVSSAADRDSGSNPAPSNPVNVTISFSEAQSETGPTVTFVNFEMKGSLAWSKIDALTGLLLGGATFQVCKTYDYDTTTGTFIDITDVCVSVPDNSGLDQDPDAGEFLLVNLDLGRYTVKETIAPPGYAADPDTETANLTVAQPQFTIQPPFADDRPVLKLTAFGYTNTPTSIPLNGMVSGRTVYTVRIKNFFTAGATVDYTLATSISTGSITCTPSCTMSQTGVAIAAAGQAGDEIVFSLTLDYTAPTGATVQAALTAQYTLNGLTRTVNGTPATIIFTVQAEP